MAKCSCPCIQNLISLKAVYRVRRKYVLSNLRLPLFLVYGGCGLAQALAQNLEPQFFSFKGLSSNVAKFCISKISYNMVLQS